MSILRLLPRQGFITTGEILLEGKDLVIMREKELRKIRGNTVSMVFQNPMSSLNPVYTVKHQIAEVVRVHHKVSKSEADARAVEMLLAVGITEDRADDYPHEFSGGMIQRVMIAIALACQPKLLILDEPTTALDVTIQAQVMELIKRLRKEFGTSMILITHDLGVVPDVCDSVAVMYAGSIVEEGNIRQIFENALHPYTKALFQCIPDVEQPDKPLHPIPGLSPNAKCIPDGCPYHPRCCDRREECKQHLPKLIDIGDGHKVACFRVSTQQSFNVNGRGGVN
jgi:peptide/nickel transport system ATP-binding protein